MGKFSSVSIVIFKVDLALPFEENEGYFCSSFPFPFGQDFVSLVGLNPKGVDSIKNASRFDERVFCMTS